MTLLRRNDPCPCGSGRKFKHCCAARLTSLSNGEDVAAQAFTKTHDARSEDATQFARNARDEKHAVEVAAYHLDVLLEDVRVHGVAFKQLFSQCMQESGTTVAASKIPYRAFRALSLARYFLRSLDVSGARVECGTLRGFSALLMCKLAQLADGRFRGDDMYVVDSFEGLSAATAHDAVEDPQTPGQTMQPETTGLMACPLEHVTNVLRAYPRISYAKGWIPEVLQQLPPKAWAFVHIDVDLYEPTLACLEYFVPKLAPGGIVVNDDYSTRLFPGSGRAWDEYCRSNGLAFAVVESGQAVLVRGL